MRCPRCNHDDSRVIETRAVENGIVIRRRRECPKCGRRFTTYERIERSTVLLVVKKDGRREAFDREKVLRGMIRACEKLPVPLETLESAVALIEEELFALAVGEVSSAMIGEMVADALKSINHVAYVRFASVYREFTDLNSFIEEISRLLEKEEGRRI
ncbi:MAG: transcriptional regulator NrdR [Acetomicrobium sp.]|jgi:transcriptional repressor NrdR|uniref:transcriptional regulator NrdR n=1 Tax=Acetomicrobium TaxID=49894 RepID=UPI0016B4A8F4|nr:transcriptional regulator NrdR [Acetomicrobium mobile]NLI43239.1 transcriptional repressor NrdR [Synergistaceae bacterium]HOB10581.1 transcriptional regulator NrdR [Acetomicrobium sp.]HOM97722.1 transcriptional regulator NrdR [Acetomicrobium sp.]HPT65195.1 transcriptional regulator NrdR [Acetomicrobium sp.]HQA36321.1 transcriptional regulator NrdR [Acetomicrobium sp.]